MGFIHFFAILTFVAIFYGMSRLGALPKVSGKIFFLVVVAAALLLRIICAICYQGFSNDTACFYGWANLAYENGLSNFYTSEAFTDYPPGFIYVLYVLGAMISIFKVSYLSGPCLLLLKLPAILCDIAAGVLVYKTANKFLKENQSILLASLYLFNPAVFLNSSIWGQVDAVFTLFVVLLCLFMTEGKTIQAYIVFGIGVLIKPQTLVFAPILLFGIVAEVLLKDFSWQRFFKNLFAGLGVIACMFLLCLPFGLEHVIVQYTSTLGSYPYVAVNAFNFWGFFGLNWMPQTDKLFFLTYEQWGTVIIVLIVLFAAFLFFKAKENASRYFTTAAFLIISMFLFSVRMHERYLFPALALLLFAYLLRPAKEIGLTYAAFSMLHFYNTAYILFFYDPQNYDRKAPLFLVVSALMVACGIFYYCTLYRYDVAKVRIAVWSGMEFYSRPGAQKKRKSSPHKKEPAIPMPSVKSMPFTWRDFAIMAVITVIYAVIALYDLGDMDAPQSDYLLQKGDTITLDLGENADPATLYWYLGYYNDVHFSLEYRFTENEQWYCANSDFTMVSVFQWSSVSLPVEARYIRLTCLSDKASLMELAFTDADSTYLTPLNTAEYSNLFDEGQLLPESISFRNGTYFDEIYHARTAYEYIHGLFTYETTHPPLGKLIMSIGILIFGMCPFGWRIMGTLFGILMVPVMYLLGRTLTKNRWLAGFATILIAADFMHFTQTRIATIDVFVTLFIMLMYYFMYKYCSLSFYDTPLKKTFIPLGASGIAMGLGIASKWTGIYAGAGLAVLFFACLYRRYREYLYAKAYPAKISNNISHRKILDTFIPNTKKTIYFCLVFFVAIPIVIYVLSYIPFVGYEEGLFAKMWSNQELMLGYHAGLEATHPYSSHWYEWPTMIRPIFYYSGIVGENLRQGISAFGNPLVWWMGIPAFIYMLYLALKKKDKIAATLCISFLAQYLPWCLVTRLTFIYHFFPSVPFIILMIMYSAAQFKKDKGTNCIAFRLGIGIYTVAAVGLFFLFYPVLSGQTVSIDFVNTFLRWFSSWVLISG